MKESSLPTGIVRFKKSEGHKNSILSQLVLVFFCFIYVCEYKNKVAFQDHVVTEEFAGMIKERLEMH